MGGKDPYSGSKGAAELVIKSYYHSFFKDSKSNVKVAVGRAGNVIGGGDWSPFRIVPDCIKSWVSNKEVEIRSPLSTRPWQHVLEPLGGYIRLMEKLNEQENISGEAFNFGPYQLTNHTVRDVVDEISLFFPNSKVKYPKKNNFPHEAGLLKLNCDKALNLLNWSSILKFKETTNWTAKWYHKYYYENINSVKKLTFEQIENYINKLNEFYSGN